MATMLAVLLVVSFAVAEVAARIIDSYLARDLPDRTAPNACELCGASRRSYQTVLGFLAQGVRRRPCCGAPTSKRGLVFLLTLAAVAAVLAHTSGRSAASFAGNVAVLVTLGSIVAASAVDRELLYFPDPVVAVGLVAAVASACLHQMPWRSIGIGALVGFLSVAAPFIWARGRGKPSAMRK
jgi:prepilin signal peptidase PulO-like enzyme (type II secretory pathway)